MTGRVEGESNGLTALGRFNYRCKFLEVIFAALYSIFPLAQNLKHQDVSL